MFSGVGAVILVVAAFRKAYHLEEYIHVKHFRYLGYILMALCAAYGYFMFSEYLTEGYKMHETSRDLLELLMIGRLAPFFWLFVVGGLLVPIVLIALPQTSNVTGITVAALAVVLGMWLKRFLIVVPGLAEPLMPSELTIYWPSQVEIAITVGAAAAIPLMLMFFFRLFPILSIYEMEEAQRPNIIGRITGWRRPSSRRSDDAAPEARPAAGCHRGRPRLPGRAPRDGRWPGQATPVLEPLPPAQPAEGQQSVILAARLHDSQGQVMAGQPVTFYVLTTVFGERLMKVGQVLTDATGVAAIAYTPSWEGDHTVVARLPGNGSGDPVQTSFQFEALGPVPLHENALFGLEPIRAWLPAVVGAAVLAVWAILGLVMLRAFTGIPAAAGVSAVPSMPSHDFLRPTGMRPAPLGRGLLLVALAMLVAIPAAWMVLGQSSQDE